MKKIIAIAMALVLALSVSISVSATALNAKSETPVVKSLSGEKVDIGKIFGSLGGIMGGIDLDKIFGSLGGSGDFDIGKIIEFIKGLIPGSGENPTAPSEEDPSEEDPSDEPSEEPSNEPTDEPSNPDTGDLH